MALPLTLIEDEVTDGESDSQHSLTSGNCMLSHEKSPNEATDLGTVLNPVQAVLVNTNSIMLRASLPQYLPQRLNPSDGIFAQQPASTSTVFGIPLVARPLRSEDCIELAPFLRELQVPNLQVRSLFRNCDVTVCDHTAGVYGWDQHFGSCELLADGPVILARLDKKPLHPLHVKMILEYVEEQVDPLFENYHVERKRWRKRMDASEYRDKVNELRGSVEAMVKKVRVAAQWDLFKEANKVVSTNLCSPLDVK